MRVDLLIHTVKVARMQRIEGAGLTSAWQEVGSIKCLLLPMSEKDEIERGLTFGKNFKLTTTLGADIQEGDRLTTEQGKTLLVDGKSEYFTSATTSHIECTCVSAEDN